MFIFYYRVSTDQIYIKVLFLKMCFVPFSCSVAQSCLTLCDLMDCNTPGFPVLHHLSELAQTHVH